MLSKSRVAILMPSKRWGGIERVNVNLSNEFIKKDIQVDLLLSRGGVTPYPETLDKRVRVIDLKANHKLTAFPKVKKYIKVHRPDALLTASDHGAKVGIAASEINFSNTPVYIVIHGTLSTSINKFWRRFFIRYGYPLADKIIAVSQGVADYLSLELGVPANKIRVIYNPVITSDLYKMSYKQIDHPWFCSHDVPVILGAGRLSHEKDFPTLIRAFASVRQHLKCKLVILGEGNERERLYNLIQELGILKDVDLPGFVSNPYPLIAQSDVFVLSSVWEGLPTVLIEALALNTPVISTDCPGGSKEILDGGRYGYLVPVKNDKALADAIHKTLTNPLRKDSLQEAVIPFQAHSVARSYLEIMGLLS